MSIATFIPSRLIAAMVLLALTGCGADAETAEPEQAQTDSADELLEELPLEELYGASPAENVWSPRFELEVFDLPSGWDGARIAVVADFRLGLWEGNEEIATTAVARAVELNPDIVVLLGGFLDEPEDSDVLRAVLQPLEGRTAVAALGRGDIATDSLEAEVVGALEDAGVTILRSETTPVVLNGDTAMIAGLDAEVLDMTFADQQYVLATLGGETQAPILLSHVPALVTRAPEGRYPLVISSNAFCGEIEVPGTPRLSWIREEIFPDAAAEGLERVFHVQGSTVLVACGLGYGFVPLRFGSPPEVPLVTLVRVGPQPEEDTGDMEEAADSLIENDQVSAEDSL